MSRRQDEPRPSCEPFGVRKNSCFGSSSNTVFSHVFLRALFIRKYEKRQENEASQEETERRFKQTNIATTLQEADAFVEKGSLAEVSASYEEALQNYQSAFSSPLLSFPVLSSCSHPLERGPAPQGYDL